MNIRVFKIRYQNGSESFECKIKGHLHKFVHGSLEIVAISVKFEVTQFLKKNPDQEASIDFSPLHDMLCKTPRLCIALSEDEIQIFWNYYNTIS